MRVYAIGDLHLSGGGDKPMDVFGPQWSDHFGRIARSWRETVADGDLVLLPGDLSWAMYLEAARADLCAVAELPGTKLILRGNHDYWWSAISQVRRALPEGMYALQNDAYAFEAAVVAGTRGWVLPAPDTAPQDERIYRRECLRLAMSLEAAKRFPTGAPLVVMTHYPPLGADGRETDMSRLIRESGAAACVYGHLHGGGIMSAFQGTIGPTRYMLVSCDALGFAPAAVPLA